MWHCTNANARVYDIYRVDYVKGAFCSTIGGACASDSDFDGAFYQNPASLTSDGSNWDYDWDIITNNSLEPQMQRTSTVNENVYSGAFAWAEARFGVGFSLAYQTDKVSTNAVVTDDNGNKQALRLSTNAATYLLNFPISYRYSSTWSVGAALNLIFHKEAFDLGGNLGSASVNSIGPSAGMGVSFGVLYFPSSKLRIGSWFRSPVSVMEEIHIRVQSFGNDIDYLEDAQLRLPALWSTGVSWMPWEDKRTLLFDISMVGWTKNGWLLSYDNFASAVNEQELYEKGRKITLEPRLGWRSPWSTGSHGTYMLGTYWEPARTEGARGRAHGTGGISYAFSDYFELMAGFDVSRDFSQIFLTYR